MVNLSAIIKLLRPVHWVKNLSVFAALVFSTAIDNSLALSRVVWAFIIFNIATSATYVFNDLLDAEKDRLHPIKKYRPIAARIVSTKVAVILVIVLSVLALSLASLLSPLFFVLIFIYLLLQVFYSLGLKNLATLDILIIAFGFILRVYAGAFVIDAHLSVWFLLCVISTALFLASGKRRAEFGALAGSNETRKSLGHYSRPLLDSYVTMFGNAAWLSWALFTFFESPQAKLPVWLFLAEISKTTTVNKLLMLTIPVVIFGIMRYESLIFEDRTEAPEKVLLTDKALITSVALWIGLVIWILYSGISV